MTIFLDGEFVPEEEAVVSVLDRSFLYGDGLFETMRVCNGNLFRWPQHLDRLQRGAEYMKIRLPFAEAALRAFAQELLRRNKMTESLLRLTLSRGIGPRGYSPKGASHPLLVMTLHPAPNIDSQKPPGWRLVTSSFRLPANERLAQFKTCNKLPQILARAEADAAGADEALLLNTDGFVVEATSSNLFWVREEKVCTPPLQSGILAGVTRATVWEICRKRGLPICEANITSEQLELVEGVFLSLSSVGVAEGVSLNGQSLHRSPVVQQIGEAYARLLAQETMS